MDRDEIKDSLVPQAPADVLTVVKKVLARHGLETNPVLGAAVLDVCVAKAGFLHRVQAGYLTIDGYAFLRHCWVEGRAADAPRWAVLDIFPPPVPGAKEYSTDLPTRPGVMRIDNREAAAVETLKKLEEGIRILVANPRILLDSPEQSAEKWRNALREALEQL